MKTTFDVVAIALVISVFAFLIGGATADDAASEANIAVQHGQGRRADAPNWMLLNLHVREPEK